MINTDISILSAIKYLVTRPFVALYNNIVDLISMSNKIEGAVKALTPDRVKLMGKDDMMKEIFVSCHFEGSWFRETKEQTIRKAVAEHFAKSQVDQFTADVEAEDVTFEQLQAKYPHLSEDEITNLLLDAMTKALQTEQPKVVEPLPDRIRKMCALSPGIAINPFVKESIEGFRNLIKFHSQLAYSNEPLSREEKNAAVEREFANRCKQVEEQLIDSTPAEISDSDLARRVKNEFKELAEMLEMQITSVRNDKTVGDEAKAQIHSTIGTLFRERGDDSIGRVISERLIPSNVVSYTTEITTSTGNVSDVVTSQVTNFVIELSEPKTCGLSENGKKSLNPDGSWGQKVALNGLSIKASKQIEGTIDLANSTISFTPGSLTGSIYGIQRTVTEVKYNPDCPAAELQVTLAELKNPENTVVQNWTKADFEAAFGDLTWPSV